MYAAVVRLDRCDEESTRLTARIGAAECANQTAGPLKRKRDRAWQQVKLADRELERLFAQALRARSGTRLQGVDELTYVHVAARLEARSEWRASRWRACERCLLVFEAQRTARRCRECKNQRPPQLRPAWPWRPCVVCGASFEPDNVQQSTCERCRATKSTRSRHPDRPVQPGTPYRRATIDIDVLL
jgi:hypothetical protein